MKKGVLAFIIGMFMLRSTIEELLTNAIPKNILILGGLILVVYGGHRLYFRK